MTWMGKLLFLAFLGFAAIVLAGPLLALISLVLTLALIGVLIWVPIQFLTRNGLLPNSQHPGASDPSRDCHIAFADAKRKFGQLQQSVRVGLARMVTALIEIVSGMTVGVLLVYVGQPDGQYRPSAFVAAAFIGGIVGVFTAAARLKSTEPLIAPEESAN